MNTDNILVHSIYDEIRLEALMHSCDIIVRFHLFCVQLLNHLMILSGKESRQVYFLEYIYTLCERADMRLVVRLECTAKEVIHSSDLFLRLKAH